MQTDLFAPPLLAGMRFAADAVDGDEEARLIEQVDSSGLSPFKFQQWTGKRLTASFGLHYDFEVGRLGEAAAMPDWLDQARTVASRLAGVDGAEFVHALVTRYDAGAGIGWHRDRPHFGLVVGLSLGAEAVMRFRRRRSGAPGFDRFNLTLPPRSAYLLSGQARHEWEHSIAPMPAPRWSVTLRTLAEGKRA